MEPARLRPCDLAVCEGVCCYDGVYLEAGEEETIAAEVAADPAFFAFLPRPFVVDGAWRGRAGGRKTAVVPHRWRARPAHFDDTRCVFALADGRCSLQVQAERTGRHKWAIKPTACWMHPLRTDGQGRPVGPPRHPLLDPDRVEPDYPGFVTSTPCGKHRDDGLPWRTALAEEIAWLRGKGSSS